MRGVAGDGADPGITEDEEVGAAGDAIDGVVRSGIAGDRLHGCERRQMAAGGEADDADAVGIDVVIGGAGAHQLHGAARIEQRNGKQIAVGTEPVLQDEGAKAARGEPVRDFPALEVGGQHGVRTAGQDDDGRAVAVAGLRIENGERGDVLAGIAFGLGGVARPQANGLDAEPRIVVAGCWRRAVFARMAIMPPSKTQSTMTQNLLIRPSGFPAQL